MKPALLASLSRDGNALFFSFGWSSQGTSRRRILKVARQERAAEVESNFMAEVFHSGMDDWEEVDILNEP